MTGRVEGKVAFITGGNTCPGRESRLGMLRQIMSSGR
jgi:hypothetical protein